MQNKSEEYYKNRYYELMLNNPFPGMEEYLLEVERLSRK